MHNSFLAFLCLCFCTVLKGQALYGTSGLLHMPTADMQKDKTVMLGGNVLDKHPLSTYWNNKILWMHRYYFFNSNIQFMFNLHKSGMPYINGNSFICVRLIISS